MQEKFLINNVDMAIKFIRTKPEFHLMSSNAAPNYKVIIQDATLFVRRVTIADHVYLAHQHTLQQANAIYPIAQVVMKSYSIPQGNLSGPQDNIFLGQLPTVMIIGFVDNDAAAGSFTKNPYNFKHLRISQFFARYGGVQIPATPLAVNFAANFPGGGTYVRAFQTLFTSTGKFFDDRGSLIERTDFPRGYALYAFDFRPDIGCKGHYNLRRTGAVQLEIIFRDPLPQTVNMIVYAEFDSYFEITHSREVVMPQ
jgi:hypothetical protein